MVRFSGSLAQLYAFTMVGLRSTLSFFNTLLATIWIYTYWSGTNAFILRARTSRSHLWGGDNETDNRDLFYDYTVIPAFLLIDPLRSDVCSDIPR